jgi:glycosyltransferase involved in cell wall biosynthesis
MDSDITVILNCHSEGRLTHATTQSISAAIERAESAGLKVEWLIVQDNASPDLKQYFDRYLPAKAQLLPVSCGDPGIARNLAAQAARGKYLTYIDGDDLFSSNWLVGAHHFITHYPRKCVVRTEWKIYFEGDNLFIRNTDQESLGFSIGTLLEFCDWNPVAFAERETFLSVPYKKTDHQNGFGFEDNTWACDIIAAGFVNKVLPGTIHALRVKTWKVSQQATNVANGCLAIPSSLYDMAYQSRPIFDNSI